MMQTNRMDTLLRIGSYRIGVAKAVRAALQSSAFTPAVGEAATAGVSWPEMWQLGVWGGRRATRVRRSWALRWISCLLAVMCASAAGSGVAAQAVRAAVPYFTALPTSGNTQ